MPDVNTVLIVGGGTGIGFAAAERLAERGTSIALAGRREDVLHAAGAKLRQINPDIEVVTVAGDAGDEQAARAIVETAATRLGGLDACINCAGIYEPIHFLQLDATGWRRTLAASLDAMLYVSVPAAKEMGKRGGGRFVLLSSINAPLSEPESAAYSAAKAGVSSLARSMAVDLAQSSIVTNAIAPGWVHTDMVDDFIQQATPETLSRLNPLGRVGRPEELAVVIEFLVLDAPTYLNGTTIFVDGGQTAAAPLI
jgi:NAD(P)-dependent dehydrogenase (short-subunit alcohol dehydrogenase family)